MTKKIFNFEKEFKLGIDIIDNEHIILVEMLNDAFNLIKENKKKEAQLLFSDTLAKYVNEHFHNEEKFMEQIAFPGIEDHRRIHENFKKMFLKLKIEIESSHEENALRRVLTDTFSWIISHIGKTDRKYANFYLNKELPSK